MYSSSTGSGSSLREMITNTNIYLAVIFSGSFLLAGALWVLWLLLRNSEEVVRKVTTF
jgi:hypothetical protein